jgi:signal transduction histidine kinase
MTGVSLTACFVSLVIAAAVFLWFDQASFRRQTIRRLDTLARVIGENSTAAIVFRDGQVAEKNLRALEDETEITAAHVYDADGNVLAEYWREDRTCPCRFGDPLPEGATRAGGLLHVVRFIELDGKRIGKLCICQSTAPFRNRLLYATLFVAAALVPGFLVAWVLSDRMHAQIATPIVKLKETAERVSSEEDYSLRVEGTTRDEVGALVAGFNDMLERIEERDGELKVYQNRLRSLASQLVLAEERQRRHIAMGLHDSTCQLLWAAILRLKTLAKRAPGQVSGEDYRPIGELLDEALRETRSLTYDLSPPVLYELGLEAALHKLAQQVKTDFGFDIVVKSGSLPEKPSENVEVLVYRAVRELLMNIFKHAHATRAEIELSADQGNLTVMVSDNGRGFDVEARARGRVSGGMGLFSIRERVQDMGGRFRIESSPGRGTTVILETPMTADAETSQPERAEPAREASRGRSGGHSRA